MSTPSGQPADDADPAELQARFELELYVAGIAVTDEDHGPLYNMWVELQPIRAQLRSTSLALEEEPSFTQKPAQFGAGITLTGTTGGGPV